MQRIIGVLLLLITAASPIAKAQEASHIAVEAMHEVWDFEAGTLTPDATQEALDNAVEKMDGLIIFSIKRDLEAMRIAAQAQLDAKQAAAEEKARIARSLGSCRITFYCPCSACCGSWGNATASGATPTAGRTVANGSLPFGTRVIIEGQEYVVEDRGVGADQFDIFVNSHDEALRRGLYYTEVKIVE